VARLRGVLEEVDPGTVPGALTIERVLGLLCVAASPGLLPGASAEQIIGMIDTAAGVTAADAASADVATARIMAAVERGGIVVTPAGTVGVRPEAPHGLRPALADAVISIADELGLLDDDLENAHPAGTVLQVKVAVLGTKPAEWRRLLLAADSDLGELHLAIQLTLDWENTELHGFTRADEPDVVFGSVDRLDEEAVDDAIIDEKEVELGQLLIEPGDELAYLSGRDDPRQLVIRLEYVH
jgi:hypothetical protein